LATNRHHVGTVVALTGLGRWGRRLLPELDKCFDVRVCCTAGGAAGGPDWLGGRFPSTSWTADFDLVLSDDAIAAVVLATPIETHAELASRALHAGKHVFVEKPLATTPTEASELASLAHRAGKVLFIGDVYLYHPILTRMLAATVDDPVELARLFWRKLGTFESDLFWNLVSHEVSVACALMRDTPDDVELLACGGDVTECDSALALLRFSGGREAWIDVDRLTPTRTKIVSVRTRRRRGLTWQDNVLFERRGREVVTRYRPRASALGRELEAFRTAVEHGLPFPSDASHGVGVVQVVTRLRAAAAQ